MDHVCPICKHNLTPDQKTEYVDYHCYPPQTDHHYSKRVATDGQVLKAKVRIASGNDRLFIKIHYDQGFSQVWTRPDDDTSKIHINHVFEPDLTDLDALRQKIRTYMVFS